MNGNLIVNPSMSVASKRHSPDRWGTLKMDDVSVGFHSGLIYSGLGVSFKLKVPARLGDNWQEYTQAGPVLMRSQRLYRPHGSMRTRRRALSFNRTRTVISFQAKRQYPSIVRTDFV